MRRFAIRLAVALAVLLVASQFVIPPLAEHHVEKQLTKHGGSADVQLSAFPALGLLFGGGGHLDVTATGLSVDVSPGQKDAFKRLDDFSKVHILVLRSTAGPLAIDRFSVLRTGDHQYFVTIAGSGVPADVASYAGQQFAGSLGGALAGLAGAALGSQPIPFTARMQIDTGSGSPQATDVVGDVAGFPAGPLAEVVANALLGSL
jgi:hypothetical protein